MNWANWLELRKRLIVGGLSSIGFLALFVSARRQFVARDAYWHLQMGRDWIQNGLSPWIDHYSFTYPGAEISPVPVMFQAALYTFVALFGEEHGFTILKLILFSLTLILVLVYLKQVKAPVFVYCIVLPTVVLVMEYRAMLRPEIFSYSLAVVALMLYRRGDAQVSAGRVLPIALLLWFWSNYHEPILGYVIFFGYFVDVAARHIRERAPFSAWVRWSAWGGAVVAVGALVPGFRHPAFHRLSYDPEWSGLLSELQSALVLKDVSVNYVLLAIALIALVLSIRQRRIGYIAVLCILLYAAMTVVRMVTPSMLVISCIFAHVVSESNWKATLQSASTRVRFTYGLLVLILSALPLWFAVDFARHFMQENRYSHLRYPSDIVEYMEQNQISGNIIHHHDIGGFLIEKLSPDSKIYIDGRTFYLYPIEHYRRMQEVLASPSELRAEIEKYDISVAILENSPRNYSLVDRAGVLGLEYVGARYSLFVREEPSLPVFGRLLARPGCWEDDSVQELSGESTTAYLNLRPDSALWPFLQVVTQYINAEDKAAFLLEASKVQGKDGTVLRFLAFRSLDHGLDELSLGLLESISNKGIKENLAAALALIRLEDFEEAERLLSVVSTTAWPSVDVADIVVLDSLLGQLQAQRTLSLISAEFLEYVQRSMEEAGVMERTHQLTSASFCQ